MEHFIVKAYWFLHEEVILWCNMSKLVIFMKKVFAVFSISAVPAEDGNNRNFPNRKKMQLLTM